MVTAERAQIDLPAAVGFRGRAAVTLAGAADAPRVLDRRSVSVADDEPYHRAASMALADARRFIAKAEKDALRRARSGIERLRADVAPLRLGSCGVVLKSLSMPSTLEATLRSHVACHAAEGEMAREAVLTAGALLGLRVVGTLERDLELRLPSSVHDVLASLGREVGPPWRKNEKLAAMAAWIALREVAAGG